MKAAIVSRAGSAPAYGDFPEPSIGAGEILVRVSASALSHVTKGRASGTHYSSAGGLPFIVGVDGVGLREDGRRVYFLLARAPYGAMAERCPVSQAHCIALPDDLDDTTAAAIAIPGMSSWAALVERAVLREGETVLVNGATGTSGRLAVQIARHLGAGRVIATGRNLATLKSLTELGADVTIPIGDDEASMEVALRDEFKRGVDVVLDYLWGSSAERVLVAAARWGRDGVPVRFVQIGAVSAPAITLPSAALRSSALVLMGSGIGSVPLPGLLKAIDGVLSAAVPSGFTIATEVVPLQEIGHAWSEARVARVVFAV